MFVMSVELLGSVIPLLTILLFRFNSHTTNNLNCSFKAEMPQHFHSYSNGIAMEAGENPKGFPPSANRSSLLPSTKTFIFHRPPDPHCQYVLRDAIQEL